MLSLTYPSENMLLVAALIVLSNLRLVQNAATTNLENEDEVIFEKVLDEPEELIEERKAVTEEPSTCVEAQLPQKENGGQCLDLLAALHNLLIDDTPGVVRKEVQAPLVFGAVERKRRDTENLAEAVVRLEGDPNLNGTNGTADGLFDFPIEDEESIFAENEQYHANRSGGVLEHIPNPGEVAGARHLNESQNSSVTFENGSFEEAEMVPPEFPPKSVNLQSETNSSSNVTVEASGLDETLIWEIATVLAHFNLAALNGSGHEHHFKSGEPEAMGRIEALLTKLLPLLVHMKASIRNVGPGNFTGSNAEFVNSSRGYEPMETPSLAPIFPRHPPFPPVPVSNNATGPTITDGRSPSASKESSFGSTTPDFDPVIFSGPIVEPVESMIIPEVVSTASANAAVTGLLSSSTGHPAPMLSTHATVKSVSYQIRTKEENANTPKTVPNEAYLKEKLRERAPHFLPKEQSTLWKAEKRRQQACVLLSSFDVIRQKCCLTLPLICPEYAAAIKGQTQRLINGVFSADGDSNAAVFVRPDAKTNGGKRGRRNGPTKNALIADTLSRISGLLSILIHNDSE